MAGRTTAERCAVDANGVTVCKPTAGSVSVLANGKIVYWNALEGTERIELSLITDYGSVALNDQTRLLDLSTSPFKWTVPTPVRRRRQPGRRRQRIRSSPGGNDETNNDGALFCSDLTFLPDGRVLAAGGTAYYQDPEIGDTGFGVVELEGLRNSRIYDPDDQPLDARPARWPSGRWYPSLVTLGNGKVFVASGVEKLVKPVYPDHPLDSFANVRKTETYDPATGKWTDNGDAGGALAAALPAAAPAARTATSTTTPPARRSTRSASPTTRRSGTSRRRTTRRPGAGRTSASRAWTAARSATCSTSTSAQPVSRPGEARHPRRRQERHAARLPRLDLLGDAAARSPTRSAATRRPRSSPAAAWSTRRASPGSYFSTSDAASRRSTPTRGDAISTQPTGDMHRPRWYPSGVLLPTGEVIAFSGADRDEVALPGTEFPIKQAELWDPKTGDWTPVAEGHRPRTYHNTAVLLPDGRVLIGGHAPITTLYLKHITCRAASRPNERDPSFEIYSPPYLFRGERPADRVRAGHARLRRRRIDVVVDRPAAEIESVVLVRNPTETHLVDDDQRNVVLRVLARSGNRLTVAAPPNGNVAPPGPYMLFVNRKTAKGPGAVGGEAAHAALPPGA